MSSSELTAGCPLDEDGADEFEGEEPMAEQVREAEIVVRALRQILLLDGRPFAKGTLDRVVANALDAYDRQVRDVSWPTAVLTAAPIVVVCLYIASDLRGAAYNIAVVIVVGLAGLYAGALKKVLEFDDRSDRL